MEKKRIVIIEEDAEIREGLAASMHQSDEFDVINQYSSYETALIQLQLDRPDAVLIINKAFSGNTVSLPVVKKTMQSFGQYRESPLSIRESEVLQIVAQGKSAAKVAAELFISKETVRSHIKNIYQKLAVNNKAAALQIAGVNHWITGAW